MSRYTVKQLAKLSGISVRALHHYDEIGLLKPAFTGENRYRYYGREELLRLQDILFHRELGVPLPEIGRLLECSGSDRVAILRKHRENFAQRIERSCQLLTTIDRTIAELSGEEKMDDGDLYKGFSPEKQAAYEDWLVDRYGADVRDVIDQSKANLSALGKEEMAARIAEGEAAGAELAEAFRAGATPEDAANEPLLARHRAWISSMWNRPCLPAAYAGLADAYLGHPDFRAKLDQHADGFTVWLAEAMKVYANRLEG